MVLFRSLDECFAHPGNGGVGATFDFIIIGLSSAFKLGGGIVTADDVQHRKARPPVGPAHVLGEGAPLGADAHGLLAQSPTRARKKERPHVCQPIQRLVSAPVAVGPVVVARGQNERACKLLEPLEAVL